MIEPSDPAAVDHPAVDDTAVVNPAVGDTAVDGTGVCDRAGSVASRGREHGLAVPAGSACADAPGASAAGPGGPAPAAAPRRAPNPRAEFAVRAFLVVSFLAVCGVGLVRLHERTLASPDVRSDLGRWAVGPAPSWFTTADARAMRDHSGLSGWTASAADPEVGRLLDSALCELPNVRSVRHIVRHDDRTFDAWVELRLPVAAVRLPGTSERWAEVDAEGVVLGAPSGARPARDGRLLRAILGATTAVPAAGGRAGPDVAAAAELSASLDETSETAGSEGLRLLDVIDLSNWGERKKPGASEVTLRMSGAAAPPGAGARPAAVPASRAVVEWGRLSHDPGEATFGAKTERLLRVLSAHPTLAGIDSVRVAFADAVIVPSAQAR
ncbi:MAG: hypothetical protein HMLKMBBP_02161 [Planctomycetes bacterium]|nr:hypothetical protein [Planctomycetota bacterium]